jgi:hypothetical protein
MCYLIPRCFNTFGIIDGKRLAPYRRGTRSSAAQRKTCCAITDFGGIIRSPANIIMFHRHTLCDAMPSFCSVQYA